MAISVAWYGKGLLACMKNDVDLESADLYLSLHTASYTPDRDAHDFADDLSSEVANGGGYTTGGVQIGTQTLSYDAASDQVRLDIDDPEFSFSESKTWRYGVIRNKRGGASSADELIALLTWDSNQTVSTPYKLAIDAAGLLYIDAT